MKPIYFDNAATTQIRDEVIDVMADVMRNNFGNASSSHGFGRSSKSLVENSRNKIASHFNVSPAEIIFTSGGTEADNLVLRSAVRDLGVKHIITTKIEHHGVLHAIEQLENEYTISVSYVDLDKEGQLDYNHFEELLQSTDKTLVSLMHVNNEIGNILDIKRVADLCRENDTLFLSDSVQSVGHYNMDLQEIPVDFIAASAHKFHGPKGVGFAFSRKGSGLKPLIFGGEQERGFRAGTESVHNIVGLEKALTLAYDNLEKESNYIKEIKSYFIDQLKTKIPDVSFNGSSGSMTKSTYTSFNVCLPVPPEKSEMLLFQLDLKGIACSKGSACQSGSTQGSHVLNAILSNEKLQKPSIRFSFSIYNTKNEVDYVVAVLKELVNG